MWIFIAKFALMKVSKILRQKPNTLIPHTPTPIMLDPSKFYHIFQISNPTYSSKPFPILHPENIFLNQFLYRAPYNQPLESNKKTGHKNALKTDKNPKKQTNKT